jgi:hypothetical protein
VGSQALESARNGEISNRSTHRSDTFTVRAIRDRRRPK